jgi:hypothetical protein
MSFDVAAELKSKIAKENDEDRRTTLMLLLGVFEANMIGIDKISKKIDALLTDEQSLRQAVLNGHEGVHHGHHEWIAKKIEREAEAAIDAKADKRAARDALIRQAVTIAVGVLAGATGVLWVVR